MYPTQPILRHLPPRANRNPRYARPPVSPQPATHQQDGWTVLSAERLNDNDEPPPPYDQPPFTQVPRDDAPAQDNAPAAAADAVDNGRGIRFEIPINTDIIGAAQHTKYLHIFSNTSFEQAWNELCQNMELNPATAQLGYKYDNERVRDKLHELNDANDWRQCVKGALMQIKTARTRIVTCRIYNRVRFFFLPSTKLTF
jgi:hypothetical protein